MKLIWFIALLICSIQPLQVNAQGLDTLLHKFEDESNDYKTRLKNLNYYSFQLGFSDREKALKYANMAMDFAKENEDVLGQAHVHNTIGVINIQKGEYANAVNHMLKSLKFKEEMNDSLGLIQGYNNLGALFKDLGDYVKAKEYYLLSYKICQDVGEIQRSGNALSNIADLLNEEDQFDQALDYYQKALSIFDEFNKELQYSNVINNMALLFDEQGDIEKAFVYYEKSLEIRKRIDFQSGMSTSYYNLGDYYYRKQNLNLAFVYCDSALTYAVKTERKKSEASACRCLYKVYKDQNNWHKALEYRDREIALETELNDESSAKEITRKSFEFQYGQKKALDSVKHAQEQQLLKLTFEKDEEIKEAAHKEELREKRMYTWGASLGLLLLLVISTLIYRNLKKQRQSNFLLEEKNEQISAQKMIVEEKNNEILDSINYAKRIQSAILPPNKLVKQYLQKSFILYKPKDIVAGDFYWCEPTKNGVLFAAADCTGHGVPGAMVSVVCNNGLNRSVREHKLTEPGDILDKTREIVISEFEKSEEEVKDGMDIALCSLEGMELKYAGAHNPLWLVRKGANQVEEIKGHKQPIGKYADPSPYPTHTIELNEGDSFYIFSDGYADQFGGDKGKKFKAANFKKLLLSIQRQPIEKQLELIDKMFEEWRGDLEQLDDVCVIGVRV